MAQSMNIQAGNTVKSQLAKLLATENLSVVHKPNAQTASFDIERRVLTLPTWVNISECLYDMLVMHEVGHALDTKMDDWIKSIDRLAEKHFDASQRNVATKAVIKDYLNVVEDARIDKRQKRRYPGSKRDYLVGYKELIERDFFGTKTRDINTCPFIDRANMYFKGGSTMGIKFSPEEWSFISRMEKLETFQDVENLVSDIIVYAQAQGLDIPKVMTVSIVISGMEGEESEDGGGDGEEADVQITIDMDNDRDNDSEGNGSGGGDGDEDGESKSGSGADDKEGKNGKDNDGKGKDGKSDSKGKEGKDSKSGSGEDEGKEGDKEQRGSSSGFSLKIKIGKAEKPSDKKSDPGKGSGGSGYSTQKNLPSSYTEQKAAQSMSSIIQKDNTDYIYTSIPEIKKFDSIVDDFKVVIPQMEKEMQNYWNDPSVVSSLERLTEWKKRESDTLTFMVKEFEMKKAASMHSRQSISKTGQIDTNKLHTYKYNDDIFRKLTVIPQGKNHGFVMILDWSSSMSNCIGATMKQLLSLVMFCKRVQIPYEVYLFRSWGTYDSKRVDNGKQFKQVPGALNFSSFKLRNIFSSRMNIVTHNNAMRLLWLAAHNRTYMCDTMMSTPLNQSIVVMEKIINDFRAKNKIEIVTGIVLTDGCSDGVNGYQQSHNSSYNSWTRKQQYFIEDKKTKNVYPCGENLYGSGYNMTNIFLRSLKERTGCHLVGFYLHTGSLANLPMVDPEEKSNPKVLKCWEENKYAGFTSVGYDEYYVMAIKSLGNLHEAFKFNPAGSVKSLAREFRKHSEKKSVNRVLLRKFIDRIAKEN